MVLQPHDKGGGGTKFRKTFNNTGTISKPPR